MSELFWWLFASLAVGGGLGTVTRKNPVASLLFLVVTFFGLAAIYVLLGAHFLGAVQIIVYAGAIMVLFLFVIMLLNLGHDYKADLREGAWIVAGFVATGLGGFWVSRMLADGAERFSLIDENLAAKAVSESNAVTAIAEPMFQKYLLPFEITGLLLLVAIVGAVYLAKRRI